MLNAFNYIMSYIPDFYVRKERKERGATMVEYAILVALISVVAIAIIAILGGQINDAFTEVRDCIQTPATCGEE